MMPKQTNISLAQPRMAPMVPKINRSRKNMKLKLTISCFLFRIYQAMQQVNNLCTRLGSVDSLHGLSHLVCRFYREQLANEMHDLSGSPASPTTRPLRSRYAVSPVGTQA
jgi:hypothetical protein